MKIDFDYTGNSLTAVDHGSLLVKLSDPNEPTWTGRTERYTWHDDGLDGLSPEDQQQRVAWLARRLWDELQNRDKNLLFWAQQKHVEDKGFSKEYQGSWIVDPKEPTNMEETQTQNTQQARPIDVLEIMRENESHIKAQSRDSRSFEPGDEVFVFPSAGCPVPYTHKVRIRTKTLRENEAVSYIVLDTISGKTWGVSQHDVTMSEEAYYRDWAKVTKDGYNSAMNQFRSHVYMGALQNLNHLFLEALAAKDAYYADQNNLGAFTDAFERLRQGFETVFPVNGDCLTEVGQ